MSTFREPNDRFWYISDDDDADADEKNTIQDEKLAIAATTTMKPGKLQPHKLSIVTPTTPSTRVAYVDPTLIQPRFQKRRSSLASIASDLSDLDYLSLHYIDDDDNAHDGDTEEDEDDGPTANLISSRYGSGPASIRARLRALYHQNYGAILVLCSQIFGTAMNVSARLLEQPGPHGPGMHPFQILFTRQSLTALLCTVYAVTTRSIPHFPLGPPDRKIRILLVCRGVLGFFGVFGMYFSLLYLPLSEATVLTFLAPILTCYLCSLLIPGERFTRSQQIAGFVSFIGVICIAQPATLFSSASVKVAATTTVTATAGAAIAVVGAGIRSITNLTVPHMNNIIVNGTSNGTMTNATGLHGYGLANHPPTPKQHLLAIAIAMLGVCGVTGAMTSIRAIGTRAHAFVSINYFSVWSTIVSLFALMVFPNVSFRLPGNTTEWALLISLGICGFIMQTLLTMGLAYGGPSSAVPTSPRTSKRRSEAHDRVIFSGRKEEDDIEMRAGFLSPLSPRPQSSSSSSSITLTNSSPPSHYNTSTSSSSTAGAALPPPKNQNKPSGNRATAMVYTQMLFALGADRAVFGTTLSTWSWVGIGLILSGAIWVAAAKDGSAKTKTATTTTNTSSKNKKKQKTKKMTRKVER